MEEYHAVTIEYGKHFETIEAASFRHQTCYFWNQPKILRRIQK